MYPEPYRPPRVRAAYNALRESFTAAVHRNPLQPVRTPGAPRPMGRCVDIVADYLGPGDELGLIEAALGIITRAADGTDPETRLPAQAFIARIAHLYADEHASNLVDAEANSHAFP